MEPNSWSDRHSPVAGKGIADSNAFDALPVIAALVGADGTIKLVNSAWRRFAEENGVEDPASVSPGANYPGVCLRAFKDGDESAGEVLEGIEAVLRGERQEFVSEYRCDSPDKKRWFLLKATPLGEDRSVVIIYLDITERKVAEEALRQSMERYQVLYEDNPSMYFTVDSRGTVLSVNRFGAEQLGYSAEELVGQSVLNVFHPADREPVRSQLENCLKNPNQAAQWEFRKVRKDGSVLWVREAARAVSEGDSRELILVVCEDITDRKLFEQELRENTEKLERKNKELQEFAFVASHDLLEPLRKVQFFGNRLLERHGPHLNEEGRDFLSRMIGAAKRMSTMINSLLTYSRVATREEEFKRVDLTQVVQEVVSDLEISIERNGGRVEVGGLPEIEADVTQMHQLFQNLIGNAIKFHRREPPLVRIRAEPTSLPGVGRRGSSFWRIFVEDNGIGFNEVYLERIFTLFQRLHGRSEYEGAGMGLAICRKIVERHGGDITAMSSPGEGSTFIVTLPAVQSKSAANPKTSLREFA
jgi:PAS domain S-box-containing protein